MALTETQFIQVARQRKYSEEQIRAEIIRRRKELAGQISKTTPSPTVGQVATGGLDVSDPGFAKPEQPEEEKKRGLLSSIFHGIADPFVRSISNIGTAAITVPQTAVVSALSKKKPELAEKIGKVDILGTQKRARKIFKDPKKALKRQVLDSANIASYAIPFGKGKNIVTKALLPGAGVGAVQDITTNEDTDIESVVQSALIGGISAGVLQKAGEQLSKLKKRTSKVGLFAKKQATKIEEGTRKIRLKPKVGGAQTEKAVNKTLTKLGFKGSAQQQYEKLQPAMNKLEGKINKLIEKNPGVVVAKEDIKKSFLQSLKTSLRSKDITSKQAIAEVNGYLNDLLKASGGTGKFQNINLQKLRVLKKLVNEDYGNVYRILERGGSLSPRQKVIDVAWKSLDDAVKTVSPKMKKLLLDESNLYKATRSLSGARVNPPTFRLAGTSIPAAITQVGRDIGQKGLSKVGTILKKVSKIIPTVSKGTQSFIDQAGARFPFLVGEEGKNDEQNYQNQEISGGQLDNHGLPFNSTTSQKNITGYTVEEHLSALSKATAVNDKAGIKQIKAQLKIEEDFQETLGGGTDLNVGKVSAQNYTNALTGTESLGLLDDVLLDKNGKIDRGVIAALKTPGTPSQKARQVKAQLFKIADAYLRINTGAQANDKEIQKLADSLEPGLTDSKKTIDVKLRIYASTFDNILNLSRNSGLNDLQFQGGGQAF